MLWTDWEQEEQVSVSVMPTLSEVELGEREGGTVLAGKGDLLLGDVGVGA